MHKSISDLVCKILLLSYLNIDYYSDMIIWFVSIYAFAFKVITAFWENITSIFKFKVEVILEEGNKRYNCFGEIEIPSEPNKLIQYPQIKSTLIISLLA